MNMSATIRIFCVDGRCFSHVRNTYHDSVELHDEDDEVLLVYGADARVSTRNGRLGSFYVEHFDGQPRWVYYEIRETPQHTRIVFGPDLPAAELEVSRRYIERFGQARSYIAKRA
jgi:hypothetical protein